MKWCRYEGLEGPAYGVVEGETVFELAQAPFEAVRRTKALRVLA